MRNTILHTPIIRVRTHIPYEIWFEKLNIEQGLILPGTKKLGVAIRIVEKRILLRNHDVQIKYTHH